VGRSGLVPLGEADAPDGHSVRPFVSGDESSSLSVRPYRLVRLIAYENTSVNAPTNPIPTVDAAIISAMDANTAVVTAMDSNSAITPNAARSIDAVRANDCVGVIREESGKKACEKQSRNEDLH
jgi:hypothetical protein